MNLEQLFHELNQQHFDAQLAPPALAWNSRLSSTAGRFCPGSRDGRRPPLIEVATYLSKLDDGLEHVRDTILHEMIHYWLWVRGRPYGHTREFHLKMRATGAKRYNPVPKLRSAKHHYRCPSCARVFPAKRRLGPVACAACCKTWNRGKFDRRFRLELLREAPSDMAGAVVGLPRVAENSAAKEMPLIACSESELKKQITRLREIVRGALIRK